MCKNHSLKVLDCITRISNHLFSPHQSLHWINHHYLEFFKILNYSFSTCNHSFINNVAFLTPRICVFKFYSTLRKIRGEKLCPIFLECLTKCPGCKIKPKLPSGKVKHQWDYWQYTFFRMANILSGFLIVLLDESWALTFH